MEKDKGLLQAMSITFGHDFYSRTKQLPYTQMFSSYCKAYSKKRTSLFIETVVFYLGHAFQSHKIVHTNCSRTLIAIYETKSPENL